MQEKETTASVFKYVDWFTVILYLILVTLGMVSIYAASYDFDHANMLSFAEFSGKQFRWIVARSRSGDTAYRRACV